MLTNGTVRLRMGATKYIIDIQKNIYNGIVLWWGHLFSQKQNVKVPVIIPFLFSNKWVPNQWCFFLQTKIILKMVFYTVIMPIYKNEDRWWHCGFSYLNKIHQYI